MGLRSSFSKKGNYLKVGGVRIRGGSRTAVTSKMELFVIIVNGFQPLAIITKWSILDVAAVLDPPLRMWIALQNIAVYFKMFCKMFYTADTAEKNKSFPS